MSDPHPTLDACLAELADNKSAETVLQQLRAIEPSLGTDALTRARFLRARAIATNRLGFASEALGDLHEARRLLEATGTPPSLREIFRAIATVFSWRGESREAALALLRVDRRSVGHDDKAALALALIEGGRLQMEIGRPAEAQALLNRRAGGRRFAVAAARISARMGQPGCRRCVAADRSSTRVSSYLAMPDALEQAPARLHLLAHLAAARVALKSGDRRRRRGASDRARAHAPDSADAFERIEIAETEAELALARGDAASRLRSSRQDRRTLCRR